MDKPKTIKVLLEVPEDFIDAESPTLWASMMIRDEFRRSILDKAVDEYISQAKIPKITITATDLKKAVLGRMSQKVIDKMDIT